MKVFKQEYEGEEFGRRLQIFAQNLTRNEELKAAGAKGVGLNIFSASTEENSIRYALA